jgi:hypothetical protein
MHKIFYVNLNTNDILTTQVKNKKIKRKGSYPEEPGRVNTTYLENVTLCSFNSTWKE